MINMTINNKALGEDGIITELRKLVEGFHNRNSQTIPENFVRRKYFR